MSGRFDRNIFKKQQTYRQRQKRVPTYTEGRVTGVEMVPDGAERIEYEVNVDMGALHDMAKKAANNQSQRSTDGPIEVRILLRERANGQAD